MQYFLEKESRLPTKARHTGLPAIKEKTGILLFIMEPAPKSLRLAVALFGRTNSGKSTLLNRIAGQTVAITSPEPGTTTDCVEKAMELLPVGPILLIDTAGLDDPTRLGTERVAAARRIYDRADVILLVVPAGQWGEEEEEILRAAAERKIRVIPVVTFADRTPPDETFLTMLREKTGLAPLLSDPDRDRLLTELRTRLLEAAPDDFVEPPPLLADLVGAGDTVLLIVPIDKQAPKGRLILPQVQTIRDALDGDAAALVVKEREYPAMLARLKTPPDLAVCDSQVVDKMVADTPPEIPCTSFSILFSRLKGDMLLMARGAAAIASLKSTDKVLIAEACSHHAVSDDIGRVKIPRWLRRYAGEGLQVDVSAGRDYPENLSEYKLVIHCGGCMLNRREVLSRIQAAARAGVPVTNYGMCISFVQGVLERVLTPFPAALAAFREALAAAETARR